MELVSPPSNMSYIVYTGNYYLSPTLFLDLKQKECETCGTVRKNMKGLSETFKSTSLAKSNNKKKQTIDYVTIV